MSDGVPNKGCEKQVRDAMEIMRKQDDRYFSFASIVWDGLSSAEREVLNQLLHQGPIYAGNILSKSARDQLIDYGLAHSCCFMGEDGFAVASVYAMVVFRAGKAEPFKTKPGNK